LRKFLLLVKRSAANNTNFKEKMVLLDSHQRQVVEAIRRGENVCCQALAGAGKSTTGMACAKIITGRAILVTYSARLKEIGRLHPDRPKNLDVHSYHSLFRTADYSTERDILLAAKLVRLNSRNNLSPLELSLVNSLRGVTFVIIDEIQDMTPLLYRVVMTLLDLVNPECQLLLIGDYFQCIFRYRGACTDYMTKCEDYFKKQFRHLRMPISYRITHEIANWINTNLDPRKLEHQDPDEWARSGNLITELWGNGIEAVKDGPEVQYISYNMFKRPPSVILTKLELWRRVDGNESLLVIMNSIKAHTPAGAFIRSLDKNNWLVRHVDNRDPNPDTYQNKSVMATICAQKGTEYENVMVGGCDGYLEQSSLLDGFCKAYVACTRARRGLLVVQNNNTLQLFTMRGTNPTRQTFCRPAAYNVTELLDHVEDDKQIDEHLEVSRVYTVPPIDISDYIYMASRSRGTIENIHAFLGIAVDNAIGIRLSSLSAPIDWLVIFKCLVKTSQYAHIPRQIDHFDWVNDDLKGILNALVNSGVKMIRSLGTLDWRPTVLNQPCLEFEHITGRADTILDQSIVIEVKTTFLHSLDHCHQAAAYAGLLELRDSDPTVSAYVVNPVVGGMFKVQTDFVAHLRMLSQRKCQKDFKEQGRKRKSGMLD
jgi:hypothetical protein